MPEQLKATLGDTKTLRDYFQKHVVYLPIKTTMSKQQRQMVATHFLQACQRYLDYINEVAKPQNKPEGQVQDLDMAAIAAESQTQQAHAKL